MIAKSCALIGVLFFYGLAAHSAETPVYKATAKFVIKASSVGAFKAAVAKIIAPTKNEPGNISYEAFQVLDANGAPTNVFEFYELWRSESAMRIDHIERAPHMQEFFATVRLGDPEGMVESFEASAHSVNVIAPGSER